MKYCFIILLILSACSPNENKNLDKTANFSQIQVVNFIKPDTFAQQKPQIIKPLDKVHDSAFIRVADYDQSYLFDIRYATSNNFMKKKVYDCGECYLRKSTFLALQKVAKSLKESKYRLKFLDCYRPFDVQVKMWEIKPDWRYVSPPEKGSMHNRGAAVDITLCDLAGNELDMGSGFDHFGRESHHAYKKLPEEVLKRRELLKLTMENNGFKSITSEWWHYAYTQKWFNISNEKIKCK